MGKGGGKVCITEILTAVPSRCLTAFLFLAKADCKELNCFHMSSCRVCSLWQPLLPQLPVCSWGARPCTCVRVPRYTCAHTCALTSEPGPHRDAEPVCLSWGRYQFRIISSPSSLALRANHGSCQTIYN